MRIVFVTSRFPYPVEKGDKLRAFHQIRILSLNHEVHLVAVSHRKIPARYIEAMSPYCKSIRVFQIRNWLLPVQLMIGWLEGLPLQVSYFLDRTIKRQVQYHIIRVEPDHIICQLIRASPYVRSLPIPKTLDYMDVFSEGMRQLADKFKWFGMFLRWEAKRLAAYERTIYKDFDKHTIISLQDRDRLHLASHEQIAIIPNGVDKYFIPAEHPKKPNHDLVFVGNLGYGPNKAAAIYLVNKLLPALRQLGMKPTLLIAGARPGRKIRNLQHHEGVTVRGWVEDIRDAYSDGRIFVAPMFSGLGLQNKILEAMSMGLPCVTTTMVNNAIGAEKDRGILVSDTLDGQANYIQRLLTDPELYDRISDAASQFVAIHYQWEDQVEKLERYLNAKNVYLQI